MRRRGGLAAVLAAVGLMSCAPAGGEEATSAVRELLAALDRGDGDAACERLSEAGVAELLLIAVEQRVETRGLRPERPGVCARVAARLGAGADLAALRRAPILRTLVEGDQATVQTAAGAYEAEEVAGRWTIARMAPVAQALRRGDLGASPVLLAIAQPRFTAPALGETLAHRTTEATIEVTGTIHPPQARLRAQPLQGATVEEAVAADGRLRVRLRLRPGPNDVLLHAAAPGREATTLGLRVVRE